MLFVFLWWCSVHIYPGVWSLSHTHTHTCMMACVSVTVKLWLHLFSLLCFNCNCYVINKYCWHKCQWNLCIVIFYSVFYISWISWRSYDCHEVEVNLAVLEIGFKMWHVCLSIYPAFCYATGHVYLIPFSDVGAKCFINLPKLMTLLGYGNFEIWWWHIVGRPCFFFLQLHCFIFYCHFSVSTFRIPLSIC